MTVSVRTFLAIDVDAPARGRLAAIAAEFRIAGAKVRPVAPGNIHVTLNFLGDVGDDALNDVCLAAADVAAAAEPFDFAVRGVRCMPPKGRPRIVWADVDEPAGRLVALQGELAGAMSALGYRPDSRRYHAHLTIARVKEASAPQALRRAVETYADEQFAPQRAGHVTTYTSVLTPAGAIYTAAARAALGRDA